MAGIVPFTDNFDDLSNMEGYQFEFRCERCGNGYRSPYVPDVKEKGRGLLRAAGSLFGGAAESLSNAADRLNYDRGTNSKAKDALADAVAAAIGTGTDPSVLVAQLDALDADIARQFAALDRCELVTGHDELGYFADRYGCEVIGAVIPSMSTTADASAKQLAELKAVIAEHGAATIFTSLGTPQEVAAQIARETGAEVVELGTHVLGGSGSYADFIRSIADDILDALR